ncbi:autophagy-related protein 9A-like [Sycon ciliatum]|uniref:autophagy-related protein 9A-like n=1 Tax=Sycon ciliatum TaxID=27933 RepID=UPI0031F6FB97
MSFNEVRYSRLESTDAETNDPELPPNIRPLKSGDSRWRHINDLDRYFSSVYRFWEGKGFMCYCLEEILGIVQFLFVIFLATVLVTGVKFRALMEMSPTRVRLEEFLEHYFTAHNASFINSTSTTHHTAHLAHDAYVNVDSDHDVDVWNIISLEDFFAGRSSWVWYAYLLFASIFLVQRVIRAVVCIHEMWGIRRFYNDVLNINPSQLENYTWEQVVRAIIKAQEVHHISVQSDRVTELDIHNRILRFKNYTIALVSKNVLPVEFHVPCMGTRMYFTEELKYLYEMILFWGPGAPFADSSNLKSRFHSTPARTLAATMRNTIALYAVITMVLSPLIFMWQLCHTMSMLGETIQQKAGAFSLRSWSPYARQKLRLYNEPEHRFTQRLAKAYDPATKYINLFISPVIKVIARPVKFISGVLFALLIVLGVMESQMLAPRVALAVFVLGIIVGMARMLSPHDDGSCPEELLEEVFRGTFQGPIPNWRGNAHTIPVMEAVGLLFPYRVAFCVEQLLSPILTPLILFFYLRPRSEEIINFFQKFTIRVHGVGDICSFAALATRAPTAGGSKKFGPPSGPGGAGGESDSAMATEDNSFVAGAASHGDSYKEKLSLLHFSLSNPSWIPPRGAMDFLESLKESAGEDLMRESQSTISPGSPPHPDPESTLRSSVRSSGLTPGGSVYASLYPDLSLATTGTGSSVARDAAYTYQRLSLATSMLASQSTTEQAVEPRSAWSPTRHPAASTLTSSRDVLPKHPPSFEKQIATDMGHAANYLHTYASRREFERRQQCLQPLLQPGLQQLGTLEEPALAPECARSPSVHVGGYMPPANIPSPQGTQMRVLGQQQQQQQEQLGLQIVSHQPTTPQQGAQQQHPQTMSDNEEDQDKLKTSRV